jgi:F-box and WD-40 domain protein 1/11
MPPGAEATIQAVAQAQATAQAHAQGLVQAQAQAQQAAAAPAPANQGGNMARVFKLQFDARRIICCSQTPIIIGWDFANGDAKIEEASRFFGAVE